MRAITGLRLSALFVITAAIAAAGPASGASAIVYIADSNNNRIRAVDISTGIITTVAGNGKAGFAGDNGPATSAELHDPYGVAVDAAGDIFIADSLNNRIRMVNHLNGIITTVAGTGTPGFYGDGGSPTSAWLWNPTGVAVDSWGNLFIADQRNNRVRLVSGGTITTAAGSGAVGFSGDGGAATSAALFYPTGVAVDAEDILYIADTNNQRIRIVVSGEIITIAGSGSVGYSCPTGTNVALHAPTGIAVFAPGEFAVADYGNQCVRVFEINDNYANVGNGTAGYGGDGGPYYLPGVELNYPTGVAVDPLFGDVYIADYVNHRVRVVFNEGAFDIVTIAGTGTPGFSGDGGLATSAQLYNPTGVAIYLSESVVCGSPASRTAGKVTRDPSSRHRFLDHSNVAGSGATPANTCIN